MLRLIYLPTNAAWVYVYGDSIIRMGESAMFHPSRDGALMAAILCGLQVNNKGEVSCA